ncbi:unnamed protein product [Gadus morhua 'NCC']
MREPFLPGGAARRAGSQMNPQGPLRPPAHQRPLWPEVAMTGRGDAQSDSESGGPSRAGSQSEPTGAAASPPLTSGPSGRSGAVSWAGGGPLEPHRQDSGPLIRGWAVQ